MADPKQIAVVTPAGDVRTIASTDAADAAEQGFELATPEQVKGAKNQAKFDEASALGKAGYVAGAAGAGALRGISAGLSDAALIHGAGLLGKDSATATRDTLNELRDVAPNASLLGEGAGMIGGLALGSGEVGFGGKALTAVSRAGGLAERGAARLLGEGATSLAGRVAQRGLATAASGAVEGALYGAGSTISEAALGDESLTGEKLVAGMGHGALVGGALGAAFGGVSGAFSRARGSVAAKPKLSEMVAEREGAAVAPGGARAFVNETANKGVTENVIKSLGATQAEVQKLAKYTGGMEGVDRAARTILKETEDFTGQSLAKASRQDMLDAVSASLDRTNEIKRGMLKGLDTSKAAVPSRQTIFQKFAEHVEPYISHLDDGGNPVFMAGAADDLAPAFKFARQMEKARVNSYEGLFNESRNLRKKIGFKAGSTEAKDIHLTALFDSIEGEMERAANASGSALGPAWSQQWNALKEIQQHTLFAEKALDRGLAANLKNNSVGLRAGVGAAVGMATGSPVGGIATALLGKIMKEQGDQVAAAAWAKVADITKAQHAVARVDSQINNGVSKLLAGSVPKSAIPKLPTYGAADPIRSAATYAATKKTERENYYTDANDIRMSAARPGALTERIAENLAPYAGSAPKAVAAASATAVRGVTFLASKLPPSGIDPTSLTPQLEKPDRMTSDIAITKWMKYKRAVDNPLSVLADAKSGKLTPEAVEAVKFVYPKIYEQLCDTVVRATVDAKRPLSYQESIRVGILLDRPTDWSMTPSAQKVIQGTYALPQQPPNQVSSGGKKINLASTYETTTTRVMSR